MEQTRSPSRGVRRQRATPEAPPAAQRARALELQRLATERVELEAQLAEVKRLMRASNLGNMCWKAVATGIAGDGSPKTQARVVQRRKRKRRPSTAPLTHVARDTPGEHSTTRRGFGAHCPQGRNERSGWVEHSAEETTAGHSSADGIARRRRNGSGERGGRDMRNRQHVQRTTYERDVPERERATVMPGASYLSTDRPASAGAMRDCPRRRIVGGNMAATLQRPQSSPRRPTATSHPPLLKHPIEHRRIEVAAATVRGREGDVLHSQGSSRFPTSERHSRETVENPCYTSDGFMAGEGRLKGGHWERGSHEPGTSSPSRGRGNSPPSAWVGDDGRTSSTVRRPERKSVEKQRAFQTPASAQDHYQGNVVEEIGNCYENDFKVVSARGSYEYVFVPWGHTLVPKRADGIGNPAPPREGRQHRSHGYRRSRAAGSHHEGAEEALSCRNSSDTLRGNDHVVDADGVLGRSDSWSDRREARPTRGGGASSWREWNQSGENGSVFQAWDKVIHKARGHRNGHVFEHLWIEYGKTGTASSAEARPGGSVAAHANIRSTPSPSCGNLSAGKVESELSLHRESKEGKRCSADEDGQVSVPQSAGGSSLYDVLLSDGSNSDETWSLGSLEQNETAEALHARAAGGAPALKVPSGSSSAQQRSSSRSRLGGVAGGRKSPALVVSSSDGSSLYNNFSRGSHESLSNKRAIANDTPAVPPPPPGPGQNQHDGALHRHVGNSAGLAVSGSDEVSPRSPSDARMARPESHAEQTTGKSLPHARQHTHAEQQGEVEVRGSFYDRSQDTSMKRLLQPDTRSADNKGSSSSSHESLFNKRKLDDETTTGNDGGRWAKEHGDGSHGTLGSKQPFEPAAPFVAKPRQRRLDRRRSTGDLALGKHALARPAASRSMGHRAKSLGSLVVVYNQGSFDKSLIGERPRLVSLRDEGLVNDFPSRVDQPASEGTGAGSGAENHGRAAEELNAEEARLIGDSGLVGKEAQTPVGEDTPVDAAISADGEGFASSRSKDSKYSNNIEATEKVDNTFSRGDEPSSVGRDKILADERPPSSGETPAGKNSDDRGRGPDTKDERIADNKTPDENLSPRESQRRQSLEEEGSHLEEGAAALARGLDAVGGGISVTDSELGNIDVFAETTPNDAQHNKQTLAGWEYVEKGARDGAIGAPESLERERELENVGSFGRLSSQDEPHRAPSDEGSFVKRGRSLKEVPPLAEGAPASDQSPTDITDGDDGHVAESILDEKDAITEGALRQEADDQRKLVAEIVAEIAAEIVAEIVAVGGERGGSEGGGRRGVNEKKFKKSREAFDEAPLEGQQPPPELLGGGSANGRSLDDRQPAEYPSAHQELDTKPYDEDTPEDLVTKRAEADGSSTHHELPANLLAEEKSPYGEFEGNTVGVGETTSSVVGKGVGVTDGALDALDADTPLDKLLIAPLDKEKENPHGVPARHGLLDGEALLAGELPKERPVLDVTQTQPQGDGDSFDGSASGRASGSNYDSSDTKHLQSGGEGSLDEYLFDGKSSGSLSLDGNSFDGQSLSDHDSENESSFGGSSPDTGSADGGSATEDDLLFDDA